MASVGEKIMRKIAKTLFGNTEQSRVIPAAQFDVMELRLL